MRRYEPDLRPERPSAVDWAEYAKWAASSWEDTLGCKTAEEDFHRFLERNPSFLPGAVDNVGPGGHHGPWWDAVVTMPPLVGLGPKRIPDFMWVRRDTDATRPILIEIERPSKRWYTASNTQPTADLTQALDQLDEWRYWFSRPSNVAIFNDMYVPARFRSRDVRPQYVLIYGRTAEFRPGGGHKQHERARSKREMLGERKDTHLYTFDMLSARHDAMDYGCVRRKGEGFEIVALPPTFHTGSWSLGEGTLLDACPELGAVLTEVPLLTDERRAYLEMRWRHWRKIKESEEWAQDRGILGGGSE